ncbi:MAG: hypothetical protein R8G33_07400 [Gammaproteobacteria bacterium]|nr:hypothetical protein [Gammaproteobacteria bacterium]
MQIVESDRARALTLDSDTWEIQFLHSTNDSLDSNDDKQDVKRYFRVAMIKDSDIRQKTLASLQDQNNEDIDERIKELLHYLADAQLPFPAKDIFEYWLLDGKDQSPLALIYSCTEEDQKKTFPERAEWTALPAAVMPIDRSEEEISDEYAPINYQVERLVAERAGFYAKAQWFTRQATQDDSFPPLLLRQDWEESISAELCQRYLQRQSPRLLMLHGLNQQQRTELEINARHHALEVERFYKLYPEIVDQALMDTIRVEARLRGVTEGQPDIHKRRDGIHYL